MRISIQGDRRFEPLVPVLFVRDGSGFARFGFSALATAAALDDFVRLPDLPKNRATLARIALID
jgi:hypothetical protein